MPDAVARRGCAGEESPLEKAKAAFEKGEYTQAIEILKSAAASEPNNGDVYVLLTRSYLELNQYDAAVKQRGKSRRDQSEEFRISPLARAKRMARKRITRLCSAPTRWPGKRRRNLQAAVDLDAHNFDAQQDLIEYDCTAPGMVGGGEEKAQPLIEKLMAMDAAEGHYATGICRAQKKNYDAADAEFTKALESKPKTAKRVYDIGDYYLQRKNGEKLLVVAGAGEDLAPRDPRGKFYRGVALILQNEKPAEAEKLLREYLEARADELRVSAAVGCPLLAGPAAGKPEESRRRARRIPGGAETERQVQAGARSAETARERLSRNFRNAKCTYAKQSRWPWTPCARTKCARC